MIQFDSLSMFFHVFSPRAGDYTPQLAMHWHKPTAPLRSAIFLSLVTIAGAVRRGGNTTRSLQNNRVCVCVCSRSLSTSGLRVKAVFLLKNTSEHHLGQF